MLLQTRLPDRSGTPELKQTTSSPHDAASTPWATLRTSAKSWRASASVGSL